MEFKQDEEQCLSDSCGTSKAQMYGRDSEFGDQSCGEPLLAQRLLIEFTPGGELDLDSEHNQKKCRAFWDFIKSKPEIQHLMAVPEVVDYGESFTSSGYQQSESSESEREPIERTAVSTLELAQKEGQMVPVFLGMDPQSHCSLGSREYPESVVTINKANKKPYVCACKGSCDRCRRVRNKGRSQTRAPNAAAVDLCKKIDKWDAEHPNCRPVCKSRRREWKGALQDTSAEQFLDRKPVPECFRRCPTKVFPNSGCPLFGRTRRVTQVKRNSHLTPEVVRICQAPLDDMVDTTYLKHAALAKSIGAWGAVRERCAFCCCGCCCPCALTEYEPRDADRAGTARRDMRRYDARVGRTYQEMRTMYDM